MLLLLLFSRNDGKLLRGKRPPHRKIDGRKYLHFIQTENANVGAIRISDGRTVIAGQTGSSTLALIREKTFRLVSPTISWGFCQLQPWNDHDGVEIYAELAVGNSFVSSSTIAIGRCCVLLLLLLSELNEMGKCVVPSLSPLHGRILVLP